MASNTKTGCTAEQPLWKVCTEKVRDRERKRERSFLGKKKEKDFGESSKVSLILSLEITVGGEVRVIVAMLFILTGA